MRIGQAVVVLLFLVSACGGTVSTSGEPGAPLAPTSATEFVAHIEDLDRPAVVNVWASWCLPCRAEAPLLGIAYEKYGDRIEFIGVDVQDTQTRAARFLSEFDLEFQHFFDRDREVVNHYGGIGTPVTFFFAPGGQLLIRHNGIIDERTLAMNIDELLHLPG